MKKILIPILWIALYLNSLQAQIKAGSWLVGGNGSLHQTRFFNRIGQFSTSFTSENLYLNPEVGYFITNRWMLGARASLSLSTISFTDINGQARRQTSYESYLLEPFTRIYFNPQHRFKCFYELATGSFLAKYNNVVPALDSLQRQTSFYIVSLIGFNYFLTDNIAIESFINYNFYNKYTYTNHVIETSFPKFSFNPHFRMRLFLNTKGETKERTQKYFEKGNRTYGMRMDLLFSGNNPFNTSNFAAGIGYFLMNNLMIGSELIISYTPNSGSGIHLIPEVRYYQPLSDLTQGFGRVLLVSSYLAYGPTGTSSDFKRQELEMGVGVNRFIAPNISVQTSLNASVATDNLLDNFQFRPSLKIGFQYFMNKK